MASLHQKYKDEIVPILKERLGESNVMALPKLTKIGINMGVGQAPVPGEQGFSAPKTPAEPQGAQGLEQLLGGVQ